MSAGEPRRSLQERYAATNGCFGCGPANPRGLGLRSFVSEDGEQLTARFEPETHHAAFGEVLNGGIIGVLLDCHSNWAAAYHLMRLRGEASPPCTVTADFHVTLRRPTPLRGAVELTARVVEVTGARVVVEATLEAEVLRRPTDPEPERRVTAICRGTFVAVEEGHPAHHRL
ncbi:MAG: PaaI family thioesterase [Deltaproteobacteria bacterium]|nr:PaaI family thioesterase [Deltaproteobacteria bacterium]